MSHRCIAKTRFGKRCKGRPRKNGNLCIHHSKQKTNVQCPICFEKLVNIYQLPCTHEFHLKCLSSSYTNACPLCRRYMLNDLPKKYRDQIISNRQQAKAEYEEELLQEIFRNLTDGESMFTDRIHLETELARDIFSELGIPYQDMPRHFRLTPVSLDGIEMVPPGLIIYSMMVSLRTLLLDSLELDNCDDFGRCTEAENDELWTYTHRIDNMIQHLWTMV